MNEQPLSVPRVGIINTDQPQPNTVPTPLPKITKLDRLKAALEDLAAPVRMQAERIQDDKSEKLLKAIADTDFVPNTKKDLVNIFNIALGLSMNPELMAIQSGFVRLTPIALISAHGSVPAGEVMIVHTTEGTNLCGWRVPEQGRRELLGTDWIPCKICRPATIAEIDAFATLGEQRTGNIVNALSSAMSITIL